MVGSASAISAPGCGRYRTSSLPSTSAGAPGKGRLVEYSLLETAIGFSSWTSAQWLADREELTRQGSRHRQNAPYQRMQTRDGYLMVSAAGDAIWARCAKALGHPEWCEDRRFATNQARMQNRDALEDAMNAALTTKTTNDWVEVLEAAGVPWPGL